MHKIQVKALSFVRSEICRDIIVKYVIHSLTKIGIFTDEECDNILRSGDSIGNVNSPECREQVLRLQTEAFLKALIKKVEEIPYAFDKFVIILYKDDNYPWIAKKLESKVEEESAKEKTVEVDAKQLKIAVTSHDVPNRVKNLIERKDKIEEIRRGLKELSMNGFGWLVLYGMGGSGKSILAAEAVREWVNDDYRDGIWWTNCGPMTKDKKFDNSMLLLKMQFLWDRFCEHSVDRHQKFECLEIAVNKLKRFLKNHSKSLIILDDVWDKEVLENFDLGVPVLITTRDKSIIPYKFQCNCIKTINDKDYGLSIEESKELLSLWVKTPQQELNNESVNRIIEKCKGNPLCLTLIGGVMEEKGNELGYWQFYLDSLDNIDHRSPKRRSSSVSSSNSSDVYNSFGFDTLVEHSYWSLDNNMRTHYKYFSLFLEDIRIPVKVFQTLWNKTQYEVYHIMDSLANKSLVMKHKTEKIFLYMVHDIILTFLKIQCKDELENLHKELLDRYFDLCRTQTGQLDYSLLPNDGYIYYFLGYHIYKANLHHLFPKIFLDLSFVVNKIRFTGPSDLLNDYFNYKEHFDEFSTEYQDFVRFISTNADLLCDVNIDVIQLSLCQPIDSDVYKKGLTLISTTDRLYLKWCNQSNMKTSKILSTKLHSGSVKFAVFSPKKPIVVSVGCDAIVRVWDSNTGKQLKTLKGHQNTINCCDFNSDGSILITASDDGTVKVWEMDCDALFFNEVLTSPRPRSGSEYPYIFNGSAIFDESGNTFTNHLNYGEKDTQIEVKCCMFSHNNRLVVSGGTDLNPHVWSLEDMATKRILIGHKNTVQSCKFSIDSELIVTSSADEVIVWCANKAEILQTLKHEMVVENCVFSGNLKYIYSSSGRYVHKWSSSGKFICRYNNLKTKYYVTYCNVSPNGKYIAAGTTTDQIIIWPSDSYITSAVATFKCSDRITCINFNNNSTQLLSCSEDGTVIIWDTSKTFSPSMVALRKKFAVQNFKQDIKVLTPDDSGSIRLFEGFDGKENRTLSFRSNHENNNSLLNPPSYDITCCALSSNLDILFGTSEGEVILHHILAKDETHFLQNHTNEVTFCAFINGLNKFVTASKDSYFRIYNKITRNYEIPKHEFKENDLLITKDIIMGPIVNCKIFSETKALIWCENGLLLAIDLRKNRLIARSDFHDSSQINSADITKSEELIATVSGDKCVTLFRSNIKTLDIDRETNELLDSNEIYSIRILKTDSCPRSCRFCPNANFLVIGDDSGKIKIWNFYGAESNCLIDFSDDHSNWVNDIAISPKGNLIISIGKSIKLWDKNGKLLQTFKTSGCSMSSVYTHFVDDQNRNSSDFNSIVTVDDAGVLYILQLMNFQE